MNDRPDFASAHARLNAKLSSIGTLTEVEEAALARLPYRFRSFPENADLVRQGNTPPECCLIVEGFVCRYKLLGEGQRQIMSFHIPGDIPDLQSLHLKVMDHSLSSLTPVTAAFIPHQALHALTREHPGVAALFWRDTLIDAAIFREWLAGVGRRTARMRIAHLICEVYLKLRSVQLVGEGGFDFPVTQAEIADALGLSTVHVNRVLQDLRAASLIASKGRFLTILDWERLKAVGDFDPSYLHLQSQAA